MANISNTNSNTLLSGTNDNDTIQNGGWWYDSDGSNSDHTAGSNVTINGDAGDDSIENHGAKTSR